MLFQELMFFMRKRGFWDTFRILGETEDKKMERHEFYKKLNEFSYYNSFLRIKNKLIEKGLIIIDSHEKKRFFRLTEKGVAVYTKLKELNDLLI